MKRILLTASVLFLLLTGTGCVRRIVAIDSQPQGAEVYFDRKLVGETPCTHEFLYYGTHHLELVKQGSNNIRTAVKLRAPIYEYFPFSFVFEVLIPWQMTDQHDFAFKLEKGRSEGPIISVIERPQPPLSGTSLGQRIE